MTIDCSSTAFCFVASAHSGWNLRWKLRSIYTLCQPESAPLALSVPNATSIFLPAYTQIFAQPRQPRVKVGLEI